MQFEQTAMCPFIRLRNVFTAAIVLTGLAFTSTASAGSCHTPPCYYKTVMTWKFVEQPVYTEVTRYDHCGKPYLETVVTYRTVKVPVKSLVKVCY